MCVCELMCECVNTCVSVKKLAEKGNLVCFGPGKEDNFIQNKESGKKVILQPNGRGSYLLKVCFLGGGETEIVVDSGAEENVCPSWWGEQFGLQEAAKVMYLRNASGSQISHWGQRDVLFVAPFEGGALIWRVLHVRKSA